MSKHLIITRFFLLPFVTLASLSAQYELYRYELPSDNILTYELDEPADDDPYAPKERKHPALWVTLSVFLILLVMVVGLLMISTIQHGRTDS